VRAIATSVERPEWVTDAIRELRRTAAAIDAQRAALTRVAYLITGNSASNAELADANHDLDHAWRHVTSARRALQMTWPTEGPEEES
jgi:hypothetical protein